MSISAYELKRYQAVVEKERVQLQEAAASRMNLDAAQTASLLEDGQRCLVHWKIRSPRERTTIRRSLQHRKCNDVRKAEQLTERRIGGGCKEKERSASPKSSGGNRSSCGGVFNFKTEINSVVTEWTELGEFQSSEGEREARAGDLRLGTSLDLKEVDLYRRLKNSSVWTRSLTEVMRETHSAVAVGEGSSSRKGVRRPVEAFVHWKKNSSMEERPQRDRVTEQESRGTVKEKGISSTARPLRVQKGTKASSGKENSSGPSGFAGLLGGQYRQSGTLANSANSGRDAWAQKQKGRPVERASVGGFSSANRGREVLKEKDSFVKSVPSIPMRTMPQEIFSRNRERRFAVLKDVRMREAAETMETTTAEGQIVSQLQQPVSRALDGSEDEGGTVGEGTSHSSEENDKDSLLGHGEDYAEDEIQSSQPQTEAGMRTVRSLRGNRSASNGSDYRNDKNTLELRDEAVPDDIEENENVQDILYPTERMRKKERRQERAWLEKEGEKRKKEGLPRNFLLVDEQTKMPYGVGVGDWRKELMLLSRDLDPAIGNINRQPEGVVAEIAEWIQHTWEYSSPVKFEYVKEVIARGVTLRRVDLWKKIRNGESRPSGMSDRTWRTLERQLENPASIMKSENCRRANASRVNFGRTGLSGEVGVRKRL